MITKKAILNNLILHPEITAESLFHLIDGDGESKERRSLTLEGYKHRRNFQKMVDILNRLEDKRQIKSTNGKLSRSYA